MRHPIQPFEKTNDVVRFKANKIVRYLLDNGPFDLNHLAELEFSQDDRVQFAQLIGYSLCGFHELNYVPDDDCDQASAAARAQGFDAGGCRDDGCEIHCGVERE